MMMHAAATASFSALSPKHHQLLPVPTIGAKLQVLSEHRLFSVVLQCCFLSSDAFAHLPFCASVSSLYPCEHGSTAKRLVWVVMLHILGANLPLQNIPL